MMSRPIRLCFLLCLLLLPAWGDVPDAPPLGACYMGYGKMLEAAQSRQLSLNAHVTRFLYQPGGLEIAYESVQKDGDTVTQSVRLVGVRRGATTTLATTTLQTAAADEQIEPESCSLAGWSADGRYLLTQRERFATTPFPDNNYFSESFQCVDVGADPIRLTTVDMPDPQLANPNILNRNTRFWWSPDRTRILFAMLARAKQTEGQPLFDVFCTVYDPKTRKFQDVTAGGSLVVRGWLDAGHLLFDDGPGLSEFKPSSKVHYASYDVNAGTQTDIPAPAQMPARHDDFDVAPMNNLSPKVAYLRLEDEAHHIQNQQKVGAVDAHALWVRRIQGPKLQSAAPVGLTPGRDDPQAVWSPTGAQIAFIAHGDLFVTDLTTRAATIGEKYAAGEKLDCQEERQLAATDLKQVGLAIIQYVQDYDEQFPPGTQWQEKIKDYLPPDALLSIGGHPVVYHTPTDLSLAKMDAPADTVLSTVDLPCATVMLYADGHVRSLPKVVNPTAP